MEAFVPTLVVCFLFGLSSCVEILGVGEGYCPLIHQFTEPTLHAGVTTPEGKFQIAEEFHRIVRCQRKPWNNAISAENVLKNRWSYVLPYDETRVVLDTLPGVPGSDYINANYIDGYDETPKVYIATQAPLRHTINDFWRMIWQEKVTRIVALANIIEIGKEKMDRYWPYCNESYGDIEVSLVNEDVTPNGYTIRTLSVSKKGSDTSREVKQFHFTIWPDDDIPSDTGKFVALVREVRKYNNDDKAPIVVHCSAGIGRTGTYMLVDSVWQNFQATGEAEFLKRLYHMREQRYRLVENEKQYVFAHEAAHILLHDESNNHISNIFHPASNHLHNVDENNNSEETLNYTDKNSRHHSSSSS